MNGDVASLPSFLSSNFFYILSIPLSKRSKYSTRTFELLGQSDLGAFPPGEDVCMHKLTLLNTFILICLDLQVGEGKVPRGRNQSKNQAQ